MKPPAKFRLVNAGPMGEPQVIKALLGPDTVVNQITIDGFEVRRQPRPPEHVWKIIRRFWDDKGNPYGGAYSLAPKEGAKALVGFIEFNSHEELKHAAKKLSVWSFHDIIENPEGAWFQYKEISREDGISSVTERVNANYDALEKVPDNYREEEGYKSFVNEMARQAREYRESLESQNPELKFPPTSGESKV